MDKKNPTTQSDRLLARTSTDDDSVTTSTESDTFDTWTLVTDKKKRENLQHTKPKDLNEHVQILTSDHDNKDESDDLMEKPHESQTDQDASLDELSDGISVISESESGGRISPHPYLQKHLNDLNIKYTTGEAMDTLLPPELPERTPPNVTVLPYAANLELLDDETQLRRRRKSRSRSKSIEKEIAPATAAIIPIAQRLPPVVRHGLTGLFYVCVALGILAFIGKLRYPEWEPLASNKPITKLEQKLTDMELQNNLMRAEIDLLTKQVNYLNTLKDGNQPGRPPTYEQQEQRQKYNKKTFKVWSGNGDSMDPVHITKDELKRPYKCPDGKFVEIAGMCVEHNQEQPPIVDQIGDAVNDVLQQSKTFKTLEKMNEKLHTFTENAFVDGEAERSAPSAASFDTGKAENVGDRPQSQSDPRDKRPMEKSDKFGGSSKEQQQRNGQQKKQQKYHEQHENRRYEKEAKNRKHRDNDYDDDDHDAINRERFNRKFNSRERQNKHEKQQHNSKERQDRNREHHSKERDDRQRYNSKERHDESKERRNSKKRNNSKENFDKKYKRTASGERFDKDGQWHEKLMQHRENARRNNERNLNANNWYIERAGSREQMRHVHDFDDMRQR